MNQLLISLQLLERMEESARAPLVRNESGGLLLGFRKGASIEIKDITFPQARDQSSPILFRRSAFGHHGIALREWRDSSGTIDWIGEWHTHPHGIAKPSFIDQVSWRKIAKHTKRPMGFIIIGATGRYVGWQASWKQGVREMRLTETDSDHLLYVD